MAEAAAVAADVFCVSEQDEVKPGQNYYADGGMPYVPLGPPPAAAWAPVVAGQPRPTNQKREGVAIVLALVPGVFFLYGFGHMYAGRVGKGFILLIGGLAAVCAIAQVNLPALTTLLWFVMIVYGPVSAARAVNRRNVLIGH